MSFLRVGHNLSYKLGSYPKSINASSLNDWFNSEKEDPVLIDVREQSAVSYTHLRAHETQ